MGRPEMDPMPDRAVLKDVGTTAGYVNEVLFWDT
jgi:hypothetical protein